MSRPSHVAAVLASISMLVAAGCGGAAPASGSVPETASLAPADAIGFVTVVTDPGSEQWENAEDLLELFPEARGGFEVFAQELADEDVAWAEDVAPALGDEVVAVWTATRRPIVLVRPSDEAKLDALTAKSDTPIVRAEIEGWQALAESQADVDAYRAALAGGTLANEPAFTGAMEALPPTALARGWADLRSLQDDLRSAASQALAGAGAGDGTTVELGLETVAAALATEDDGLLVSLGIRLPDGASGQTAYEPRLLDRIPADAVAVLSFGGTQGTLDRLRDDLGVDLEKAASYLRDATGISLESVFDAFRGEGALYVRPGGEQVPDVTLALTPPDPDATLETIGTAATKLAEQLGTSPGGTTVDGVELTTLDVDGVALAYGRDGDTILVTTHPEGVADFLGDGSKLGDADAFTRSAERVGLGDRTQGFLYVDVDGLVPLIESAGGGTVPPEAGDVLERIDATILQASPGDGGTTQLTGFVRVAG